MIKKLFIQIKNEWSTNIWLMLELLVVSVVMWYIVDRLYCTIATRLEPKGFDIEHCYLIEMGALTDKSPDYKPYNNYEEEAADVLELLERIRRRPEIEAASLSQNSYPYNGSNTSVEVRLVGDTLQAPQWTIRRLATPDFPRVFRYHGVNGETPEQLAEMLERDEFLASNNLFSSYNKEMKNLVGQRFYLQGDTTRTYRLGAALQDVRYHDYQQARYSCSTLGKLSWYNHDYSELCVRVRADQDHDFIVRLKADSEKQLRVGNIFISEVRPFYEIRDRFQQMWSNRDRDYFVGLGFLLLNIFLGLLGTFWFRTQQRRGEIALHKVHGATNGMVFTRLMVEGLFLLILVTLPALLIDFALATAELNSWRNSTTLEYDRLFICATITFLLIALMILIGIWFPARKAMEVQPAEALHDE